MIGKYILLQNYHYQGTLSLAKDFKKLGYKIFFPDSNWGGKIDLYMDNSLISEKVGGFLISLQEFVKLGQMDVICASYDQLETMYKLAQINNSRLILHAATNNVPYPTGVSEYLLSPDIQTFINYKAKRKMLYFPSPNTDGGTDKDYAKSYSSKQINSYIHYYEKYWKNAYKLANEFAYYWGNVKFYGLEARDGILNYEDAFKKMKQSFMTLNFKEKDGYSFSVIESMVRQTPVISIRDYIQDITLGIFFLDESNSIIADNPDDAYCQVIKLSYDDYVKMAQKAKADVLRITDEKKRLNEMSRVLDL